MKRDLDCPECFAKPEASGGMKCASCPFRESCRYCRAESGEPKKHRTGRVSFERGGFDLASPDPRGGREEPVLTDAVSVVDCFRRALKLLNDVDPYSIRLLTECLDRDVTSAAELARKFGVSRQAIHRKLVDCCSKHPELRGIFIVKLGRCQRILRDSARRRELMLK